MSCRVTVQENPCCTVCYIVSLMYFFCALNEAFIRREIGFEAADEIVMVSMICLAAEQAISWWIMLNHRGCHPATLSHGSRAVNTVSCSVTSESLPTERRITPTHLLKSQLPFLLINCDHLLKSLRCVFYPDLFLITFISKRSQPPYISARSVFENVQDGKKARLFSLVEVVW